MEENMITKKWCGFILIIILECIFIFSARNAYCDTRSTPPIFDGNDGFSGSTLHLEASFAEDCYPNDDLKLPKDPKSNKWKSFKSKKWTEMSERWHGRSRILMIDRYYFESSQDARLYPEIALWAFMGYPAAGAPVFPGWSQEIAEGNFWLYNDTLVFVKNNILVSVQVNSTVLGKDYLIKVAKNIERKL
jgi:hypothetical protein